MPLGSAGAAHVISLPAFSGFVASVVDGQANVVRGVYVPEVLALRVLQQPAGDNASVLRLDGVVTQFRAAAQNHVIGLLAHNDMAGASFAGLQIGQEVRIVYGNGRVDYYSVNRLASFQALQSGGEVKQLYGYKFEHHLHSSGYLHDVLYRRRSCHIPNLHN